MSLSYHKFEFLKLLTKNKIMQMKKVLLIAIVSFLTTPLFAQKYDEIKNMILLGQTAKAKELFQKNSANEKFYTKPEGYLLKANILGSAAVSDTTKSEAVMHSLNEGYEAFLKYKEMEPALKLMSDPVYQNTPYWLYAAYFNSAVPSLNSQDDAVLAKGYDKMKKAVELSDLLIAHKIQLKGPIDTSLVFYTGYLAERANDRDGMMKYYTRLADAKIAEGADFERVYQNLVRYYALKQDNTNFEKYRALGKEVYPKSDFFNYSLLDFAVGGTSDFNEKITNLEKMIQTNPDDKKALTQLAAVIFDTLDTQKEGAVRPANYDELEGKMVGALNKLSALDPNDVYPHAALGDHYNFKSEDLRNAMIEAETARDKKGAKATAADKQKYVDAKKAYDAVYDLSGQNYQKAAELYSKMSTLDNVSKRSYRIIVGNLVSYYSYLREGKTGAELNKIVAQETKYNNLYEQLRKP